MAYDTVKNGIATIITGQGYAESSEIIDFENAPANEFDNVFILRCVSGIQDEDTSDSVTNILYDDQIWEIKIAFGKTHVADNIVYDDIQRIRETLVTELDDPANWRSYVVMQKYTSWEIEIFDDYFVLVITIKIKDRLTY